MTRRRYPRRGVLACDGASPEMERRAHVTNVSRRRRTLDPRARKGQERLMRSDIEAWSDRRPLMQAGCPEERAR